MSRKCFNLKCLYGHGYKSRERQGMVSVHMRLQTLQNKNPLLSPEHVLSPTNKSNCLAMLNRMTISDETATRSGNKAAVLVPLCKFNGELALLFTVRARHLKVNAGEVAFPGGMYDKCDENLKNTALREANEEVGIIPDKVDIWGKGPGYIFKTMQTVSHEIHKEGVSVTPFLGYIGDLHLNELKLNSSEVSYAFAETLANLSSPENFQTTKFRSGKSKSSVYIAPVYLNNHKRIWGFTAYITHVILSCLIPDVYKKNIKFRPSVGGVLQGKN